MARASILRQLPDERLDELHHAIRRDAMSDLEIARLAEKWLGRSLGKDEAAAMVIARYRASGPYKKWLERFLGQDMELKRQVAAQKQRFEFLSSLVQGTDGADLEAVSKSLQARLLVLASEMSDEELRDTKSVRWIKGLFDVVGEAARAEQRRQAEKAVEVAAAPGLSEADREQKLKQIFGIT